MKIKRGSKYEKPLNTLIRILEGEEDIEINKIKDIICDKYNTNEEIIDNLIFYLIDNENIKIIDESKRFNNQKITLVDKPDLKLETIKEEKYPKMVLTLPPFNKYGIESKLGDLISDKNNLKKSFMALFKKASSNIYICSPFLEYTGIEPFINILISKAKQGVNIKVLSRQIKKNNHNTRYKQIEKLKKHFIENDCKINIRNYYYQHENRLASSTHAKMIIVDKYLAYIGSGELRQNSYNKNLEVGLIIRGEKAEKLGELFEYMFEISEEIN